MLALKPLQSDYQNGWQLVNLYLFERLLVKLAVVTVPLILLAQLLWSVELPETV
jgi:hypothetical protein